nr:MAG TPA: hypothetical protein [Caudoviricetes sp.]
MQRLLALSTIVSASSIRTMLEALQSSMRTPSKKPLGLRGGVVKSCLRFSA